MRATDPAGKLACACASRGVSYDWGGMLALGRCGALARAACSAVGAAALAGCGASNAGSASFGGGGDAGIGLDSSPGLDAPSVPDALPDTLLPPPPPPTVTFVHASPSLGNARLCWALLGGGDAGVTTADPPFPSGAPMPQSNFPGLPVGGAAQLSPATELANASAATPVEIYAIDALVLARLNPASPSACRDLVCLRNPSPSAGSSCLRLNKDYWHAGTLAAGAIAASGPTFVALAGCEALMPDPAASVARCGADWDPVAGNLHVEVLHVASASGLDAGALAVQTALFSPALEGTLSDAGARISFGPPGDAGTIALLQSDGLLAPRTPALLPVGTGLAAFGTLGFGVDGPALDAAAPSHLWMSLAQAQSLVDPTADPRVYFGAEATYLAAIIGDPSAPAPFQTTGAAYDGRGLHVLVLPSLPTR
jgi:hypothetical protein